MLGDALSFPTNDDDWLKTHIIGGVLLLVSFFIPVIPQLPVTGMAVESLRRGARGEDTPPAFDDWETLFIDGLKVFVIGFVYAIPLVILFFVLFIGGIFSLGLGGASGSDAGVAAGGIVFLLLFGVGGLLTLLVAYIAPAAIANFAVYDDLGKAFAIGEVLGIAFTADYFIAIVLVVIVGFFINLIGGILALLLVGLLVLFFGQLFTYHLIGQGYAKARQTKGNPVQ